MESYPPSGPTPVLRPWLLTGGILSVTISILVLLGWSFDIQLLTRILPNMVTMKPQTASTFLVSGFALCLYTFPETLQRRIAAVCAVAAALVGFFVITQYLSGWDLGIDRLLFRAAVEADSSPAGRMAFITAIDFLFLNVALLLLNSHRLRFHVAGQLLTISAWALALLALIGYLYGIHELYSFGLTSSIALHTALLFFIVTTFSFVTYLDRGITRDFIQDGPGSITLRNLLPVAILLPILLGWLQLQGQAVGLYQDRFGTALLMACQVVGFSLLIIWTARHLSRLDTQRRQAEEQAYLRLARLRSLHAIDRAISTLQPLSMTLSAVVDQVAEQLAVNAVAVMTFHAERQVLTYAAGTGFHSEKLHPQPVSMGEGSAGKAALKRRIYYSFDPLMNKESVGVDYLTSESFASHYSVPLVANDKLVGVLELCHRAPLTPDVEWLSFLEALALQTSIAIDHALLFARTQEQAQRLQQILNTVREGILLLDAEQRVVVSNPTAKGYLSKLNNDDLPSQALTHLGRHALADLLTSVKTIEVASNTTDCDEETLFEMEIEPLRAQGTTQGWVILLRDVTEARQRMEALQQRERLTTVGQLAAGIAHDVNNILTPILLYAELGIKQTAAGSQLRHNLERMLQATLRARDLVARVLAFGRQNTGQLPRLIELQPVIQEALMLVRTSLPSTVKLEVTLPATTGFVMVDTTEIHQIVMNLCTNAIHAMQEKGGTLGVHLEAVQVDDQLVAKHPNLHPGPYVCLTIRDSGHGMSQATIARIFDPFFTTKGRGQGTGLGLAVVYGLVTKHGGTITVESVLDQGTTFKIYMPRVKSGGLDVEEAAGDPPHGTEHILVVDDEESIVQVVTSALADLGYTVLSTTSGRHSLEMLHDPSIQVDLMLTDLTMPDMSGLQLAQSAQQIRQNLPVVLMTGYGEVVTEAERDASHLRDLIVKPFSVSDLGWLLRRVLATVKSPAQSESDLPLLSQG